MLTLQFMNGKHMLSGENLSMFNLTKTNLGPFNHSNIISGQLRVINRFFHRLELYQECMGMANSIQNQIDHTR
jgi:hypothetical protein